jgi:hypothetical protein
MPADVRVGSGSQDRAAAAQAGRGGADFVVVEAKRRPRQNWGNRASLTLAPPGRHDGQSRRQSLSDVGRAGEAPTHATVLPATRANHPSRTTVVAQIATVGWSLSNSAARSRAMRHSISTERMPLHDGRCHVGSRSRVSVARARLRSSQGVEWGGGVSTFVIRSSRQNEEPRRRHAGAVHHRSSTRIIVRTRVVLEGSAGSSEPALRS